MYIKFNNSEDTYEITAYRKTRNFIMIKGKGLPDGNTSGFKIFNGAALTGDFPEYTKKYNVLTQTQEAAFFTSENGDIETEDNRVDKYLYEPAQEDIHEDVDPLTNEELTECVADLMYEVSMSQLGL